MTVVDATSGVMNPELKVPQSQHQHIHLLMFTATNVARNKNGRVINSLQDNHRSSFHFVS